MTSSFYASLIPSQFLCLVYYSSVGCSPAKHNHLDTSARCLLSLFHSLVFSCLRLSHVCPFSSCLLSLCLYLISACLCISAFSARPHFLNYFQEQYTWFPLSSHPVFTHLPPKLSVSCLCVCRASYSKVREQWVEAKLNRSTIQDSVRMWENREIKEKLSLSLSQSLLFP